jgi:KUP system potassium uptake protein
MDQPVVPPALALAKKNHGLDVDLDTATYFLGRESVVASDAGNMGSTAEGFFGFLSRNARSATTYFELPPDRVVELGTMVDL